LNIFHWISFILRLWLFACKTSSLLPDHLVPIPVSLWKNKEINVIKTVEDIWNCSESQLYNNFYNLMFYFFLFYRRF
jgi:hypothetical protein